MADQADGSIIVDTEIDAQGFRAGSAELQRAIKSLNTKIEALGPTFQKALSGNASAMSTFDSKAAALESTISQLEAKLESLGNARVPTEDYQWLTTEIQKAENELAKLEEKQVKMEDMGVSQNSQAWKSLQYDIDLAKRKIEEYKGEQASMRENGTAFQMGSNTAEYAQLESALASAKSRLAEMRSEAESAGQSTSKLGSIANGVKSALAAVGRAGVTGFKKLVSGIKSGISHLKNFRKSSGGAEGAIGKLGKKITGLGSMLKRMVLRKVLMGIIQGVKEGFNNLAQYSSSANANISTLKSGLTQLKNSFATAFAPILTVVTPVLAKLISYLSAAVTWIGKLFAALTGAKTFTKATAVQEDYAASLGGTASAAKDAKRQLAGFDDLNVLSDSGSDGGGGGGGATPSEMFEEVPIESSITDFINSLKDAFRNGDYAEIGVILGTKINEAVQKVHDFISWDNVGGTITKVIKGFAEAFNALVYTIDWALIGDTFAEGINTLINTIYLLTTEIDWPALAGGIATGLSSAITGIDWAKLGTTLSTQCRVLLQSIRSAIQNFNWLEIGKCVATGINNIDWVGILSDLAGAISDIIKAALDLLIGFADNLDWGKLGRDLWNGLIGVIQNIDWGGIISKAFHLLGSAIGGCAKLVVELCKSIWESLKQGFEDTKEYFNTYIEEAGGNIIEGIWNGIIDALKNVGNWIVEHIWNPFIEGFKNAFGIHSPSTKMAEQGGYIIEGLWQGIKDAWHSITEFFSEKLEGIKTVISNAWNSIKTTASTAWNGIKTTLSGAWNGIKTTASNAWNGLKTTISTGWNNIKTEASEKWNTIKTNLSNTWNSIKSTASTTWTNLKSTISTKWTEMKTDASEKWNSVKTSLTNTWNGIKSTASTTWSNLKSTVSTKWTEMKTDASTKWSEVKTSLTNTWNGIKSTASTTWTNLKSTISTKWTEMKTSASTTWDSVKSTLSSKWDSIKSTASTTWTNLKSTISTKWTEMKNTASSTWDSVKSSLSSKWDSIKSTASSKFDSIKSTISNKGWSGVGSNITSGIGSGIDSGWSWLKNKVSSLATSLLDKAKSALGIHSPSRLFRDTIGLNIGLGVGEGIEDAQPSVLDSVTGMADAISTEMKNGDYTLGEVTAGKGLEGSLVNFSDTITDGFSSLIERLQSIADSVTFSMPVVAKNGAVPYSVSTADAGNGGRGVSSAIEASNDELASVVIQSVTNATTAIVHAIQSYSGTTVNLDSNSLAANVIKEINRRTRMSGNSPLVG